jgi:GMP synthase-like glutamine amidotransferase
MKILVIDNGTIRLNQLKKLVDSHEVTVIGLGEIDLTDSAYFDLIILSGSSLYPIIGSIDLFKSELELIKKTKTPIIGICFGFELIAYAYGASLIKLDHKLQDIIEITTLNNEIFKGLPNLKVYEAHRWIIKTLPPALIKLAISKNGIEAFKHKTKQIYGFQFHPEMFPDKTCGDEIFFNTIRQFSI